MLRFCRKADASDIRHEIITSYRPLNTLVKVTLINLIWQGNEITEQKKEDAKEGF